MTKMLIFVLLIIHILVCLVCLILTRLHILKSGYIDLVVLALIPVFGLASLLLRSHTYREEARKARNLELAQLKINDDVHRSIDLDKVENTDEIVPLSESFTVNDSKTQRLLMKEALYDLNTSIQFEEDEIHEKVVPIQEALLLNNSHTKREIIMDVLYTNPSGFIPQLSEARENDDSEVVHYAVTALVEIQKEFDLQFQAISKELMEKPDDETVLRRYQNLLERYLSSGLLEGSHRDVQLRKYVEVLKQRLENHPESLSLWIKKADADMLLKNLEDLRTDAERMIAFRAENEQGYLYLLKYYALLRDSEGVRRVIDMTDKRKVYMSPSGRAELEFWRK